MSKLKIEIVILILVCFISLSSTIDITYENTWTSRTSYGKGIEINGNNLFVNAKCAIENYEIGDDGSLELVQTVHVDGFIKGLIQDTSNNKLYVHSTEWATYFGQRIIAYNITEGLLEYDHSTDDTNYISGAYNYVFFVGDYVIYYDPDIYPGYNQATEQFEEIYYPYFTIIGSFGDILVEYIDIGTSVHFYRIEDINDPALLLHYDYGNINTLYRYVSCFDNQHCIITNLQSIEIFNVSDEENYFHETTWEFDFMEENEYFLEPKEYRPGHLFIGTSNDRNVILNIQNYENPEVLELWETEDINFSDYCLFEDEYLYQTVGRGIAKFDMNELPEINYELYGETFPKNSTAYFDGVVYKNDDNYNLYRVDCETLEQELICEIPYEQVDQFYKIGDYLLLYNYNGWISSHVAIIDLIENEMISYETLEGEIFAFHNNMILIEDAQNIYFYTLNESQNLELVTSIDLDCVLYNISYLDEDRVWICTDEGDLIYNTSDLEVEYNYYDFFNPGEYHFHYPLKYDNKLIIADVRSGQNSEINLYEFESFDNLVLLDSKTEYRDCIYYRNDDIIFETTFLQPTKIYDLFTDSFTEPILEFDFANNDFRLEFDPERNIIISNSTYKLQTFTYEQTDSETNIITDSEVFLQNFPNPFNPKTTISYNIPPNIEKAKLNIFNTRGQVVDSYKLDKNSNSFLWNGDDFPTGIYFLTIETDTEILDSQKMLLLK